MALFLVFPLFSFSKLIMPVQVVDLIIICSCSLYILFYFLMILETRDIPVHLHLNWCLQECYAM